VIALVALFSHFSLRLIRHSGNGPIGPFHHMVLEMLAEGQIFMCSPTAIPLESSQWSGLSRCPIRPETS
jgi:hypothetical protein